MKAPEVLGTDSGALECSRGVLGADLGDPGNSRVDLGGSESSRVGSELISVQIARKSLDVGSPRSVLGKDGV